jgi:hypothetical protein
MAHRSLFRITPCLAAALALAVVAHPAAAQDSHVIIGGGDRVVINSNAALAISDDVLRKLIETHLPDALLNDGADAHHVSITIDANDQYVSGKVTKASARVATGSVINGVGTFVIGDSTGDHPNIVTIRRSADGTAAAGPASVSVFHSGVEAGEIHMGAFGSDHDMADVASIGFRRFAAGSFSATPLVVTVIKLK